MKLQFYWMDLFGQWEPKCRSDGPMPLALILADTGGLPYLNTISWIDEGLRLAGQVRDGQVGTASWGREAYAAHFSKHEAKIYFQLNESCCQVVEIDSFIAVLTAWRQFIQTLPDRTRTEEIDVPT